MKLLVWFAVLSVCMAVSLAGPAKIRIRDEDDSSVSVDSSELKIPGRSSSSSEEESEQTKVQPFKAKVDNEESDTSADSSEEAADKTKIVKDENNEINSIEQEMIDDNEIVRPRRAVTYINHPSNLLVKDQDAIKHEKFLKLKRLRRAVENIINRMVRNADTSEENSSEEHKHGENHGAHEHSVLIAKKPETAPAETLDEAAKLSSRRRRSPPNLDSSEEDSSEENKTGGAAAAHTYDNTTIATEEGARRRRSTEDNSEEDQSAPADGEDDEEPRNEVFFFSKEHEQEQDFEEKLNSENLKTNEYIVPKNTDVDKSDLSVENKNSEEDYAKGCGGNRDDDSKENSNEDNEILNDKL